MILLDVSRSARRAADIAVPGADCRRICRPPGWCFSPASPCMSPFPNTKIIPGRPETRGGSTVVQPANASLAHTGVHAPQSRTITATVLSGVALPPPRAHARRRRRRRAGCVGGRPAARPRTSRCGRQRARTPAEAGPTARSAAAGLHKRQQQRRQGRRGPPAPQRRAAAGVGARGLARDAPMPARGRGGGALAAR
jgi:hypothetical protein